MFNFKMLKPALIFLVVYTSALHAQIGNFTNSGRVVDQEGNPVANAFIRYTDPSKRLIYTFSDSNGNFPSGGTVSIKTVNSYNSLLPFSKITGTKLYFIVEKDNIEVNIRLYSLSGRKIATIFDKKIKKAGNYSINPLGTISEKLAGSVYLIKGTAGSKSFKHSILNVDLNGKGLNLKRVSTPPANNRNSILKTAAVDQIRVGKTGYTSTTVDISSYDENTNEITIAERNIEIEIDGIISGMSVEQKIAQMTMAGSNYNEGAQGVGTMLWGAGAGTSASDYDNKQSQWTSTAPFIPIMIGYDNVHGVISPPDGGTILPHNSAMGCIQDTLLIQKAYRMTAIESAAMGCYWTFAPCIAVARDEHWGRIYESPGEDPELVAKYARHAVLGLQGRDLSDPTTIAATLKHFAGDGGTENGINAGDCNTGNDEILRSIHMPPFAAGIEAGAATVMPSFSKWMGLHMHAHKSLLTDWLKTGQNFQGFIVGDWTAHRWALDYTGEIVTRAYPADDVKEGTYQSIKAGLDNPMCPGTYNDFKSNLSQIYSDGFISDERINDAVRRILRVKHWLGLYENHSSLWNYEQYIRSPEHWEVARECVAQSMVVLKNDNNALPLSKSDNISVIGKWGNDMGLQCGSWTLGHSSAAGDSPDGTTLYEALSNLGNGYVEFSENGYNISQDVAVVAVGAHYPAEYTKPDEMLSLSYYEGPSDDGDHSKDIMHYGNIDDLMGKAVSSGKKIILVLFIDAPVAVTGHIENADAVVCAWLPGVAGEGMADILYGDVNPSGKLAWTWPRTVEQIPINHGDYGDAEGSGGDPLFELGYGLTY